MPPTSCLWHGRRSGVPGGRRLGLGIVTAIEHRKRVSCVIELPVICERTLMARTGLRWPNHADLHRWACEPTMPRQSAGAARPQALTDSSPCSPVSVGPVCLSNGRMAQIWGYPFWIVRHFVEQPQTYGVAVLVQSHPHCEQIIHGRIYWQHRGAAERRPRVHRTIQWAC